jgi:hypothetical protein
MGTVTCPLLLIVLEGGIFTYSPRSKDNILYHPCQSALTGFARTSTSITHTVMPTLPVYGSPFSTGLLHARIALIGSHS